MNIGIKILLSIGIVIYIIWSVYVISILKKGLNAKATSAEAATSGIWLLVHAVAIVYVTIELIW